MFKKISLLIFFLTGLTLYGISQSVTNYTFAASAGTFTALTTPTNPTISGTVDEGFFNNIPIGFDFWYMVIRYTTVSVSTNGWLTLGANITNATPVNLLATGGAPRPVIAPLWDDLDVQLATNVSYKTTGSSPNRIFTTQYLNAQWAAAATGNTISFQVRLYESTGKVDFIYRQEAGALSAASASIGITATAINAGNYLSLNGAGATPTASSTVETTSINAKPTSGRTYAFTPPVPTAPGSLTFSSIGATSMTLNWSDLSSNETGFVVYRSIDGVTYSFISQTAAGATSSAQSGLTAGTNYFWRVYAVSEGGLSSALSANQATARIFTGVGNFSTAASWTGGILPVAGESLIIDGTCTVDNSVTTDNVAYGTLTIGTATGRALNWAASGTNRLNVSDVSAGVGASTLNMTNGGTLRIRGALTTTNLSLTLGATSTVEYSGTNQAVSGQNYGHLTLSNSGVKTFGTVAGSNIRIAGALTISGTATADLTTNTTNVSYFGSGAQTIPALTYYDLTSSTSGTKTLAGNVIVNNSLTITGPAILDLGSFTANRASSGGTLTLSGAARLNMGGVNTMPSNYTTHSISATSTIDYGGTTQSVTTLNSVQDYGNLIISGSGIKTLAGTENVAGNLTISAGTFDLGASTINRTVGGGTLTLSNGATLKIGGANTFPTNYAAHSIGATSTIEYGGTTQSVVVLNSAQNYGHLIISGSAIKTLAGTNAVAGNLSISAGTFDLGANTINRTVGGGTLTVSNGAALKIGGTNTFPTNYTTHSIGATSTIEYGGTTQSVIVLNSAQNYGHLIISGSAVKTLAGTVVIGGDLTTSAGTFDLSSFTASRASAGGTITISNGAILKVGGTNPFPTNYSTRTLGATSTVDYSGTIQAVLAQNYGHLTLSNSGAKTFAATTIGIAGTFTISGTATANMTTNSPTVDYNGGGAQLILAQTYYNLTASNAGTKTLAGNTIVSNNLAVSGNTTILDLSTFTADRASAGGGTLSIALGSALKIGGTNTFPSNYSTHSIASFSTVEYAGTNQIVAALNSAQEYNGLTISGSGTKTLAGDLNVAGNVTLLGGIVTTGAYTLYIKPTGNISRVSGHVNGNLKRRIAIGALTRIFDVGDANNYTPVAIAFVGVTTAGDLAVSVAGVDHTNIVTSAINASKSVNRNWSLTNSGIVFTTYGATFTFAPGTPVDLDAGANTSAFIVGKYSAGSWTYPTVGTKTGTTTQATGLTTFSDFQLGEFAATYSISGKVFEDMNYGGGAGRSLASSSGVARPGARVEVFDSGGTYQTFTTTDGSGNYTLSPLQAGTYTVRVVNNTVTTSRGVLASTTPTQTFRTDASSGAAVAVTDHVGGEVPGLFDAVDGSTTLAALTTGSETPQSITTVALSSGNISGVDFGYSFNVIVNANNQGQGSLRRVLIYANAMPNTGLAQSGLTAGIDNAIFMLADGTARPGLNASYPSQFVSGVATISLLTAYPTITDPVILDASLQPGYLNVPMIELNGAAVTGAGFTIMAGSSTVRGFIINRFTDATTGIGVTISTAGNNTITGNYIGTNALGTAASPNTRAGILINSNNNIVGGMTAGAGNLISGNGKGVAIVGGAGNGILSNSIYGNTGIGIDLADDGVTVNDGIKSGPANSGMDAPVFTTMNLVGTTLSISGYVGSAAGQAAFASASVQVFKSDNDASGSGEGQALLGALTTDASGNFSGALTVSLVVGDKITGTATDGPNSTSEFGLNALVNVIKTFTGIGNFSTAARWTGGTLPIAGENFIIDGTCTVDNNAGTNNVAYGTLTIGTAIGRTLNWAAGGTNRLNVSNVSAGAGASTLLMDNGGTLVIRGTWTSTNLTFTSGLGTIEIQSSMTLPAAYTSYSGLTVNGSGITVGLGAATAVDGNLLVSAGTFTIGTYFAVNGTTAVSGTLSITSAASTRTFTNNVTINNGGTWNESVSAATSFGGNLQNDGTLTDGGGVHTFTGATKLFSGANAISIANVTVTGTYTNNGTLTVGTAVSGAGSLTQGANANLNLGGTSGITTLAASANPNTINYNGAAQTIKATTYHHLILSNAGAKIAGGALTIQGNWNNNSTFTAGTGTVTFNGSGAQTLSGSSTTAFYDLTVTKAAGTATALVAFNVDNNLNLTQGVLTIESTLPYTVKNLNSSSGTTFNQTPSSPGSLYITGDLAIDGTYNALYNSSVIMQNAGGINFIRTGTCTGANVSGLIFNGISFLFFTNGDYRATGATSCAAVGYMGNATAGTFETQGYTATFPITIINGGSLLVNAGGGGANGIFNSIYPGWGIRIGYANLAGSMNVASGCTVNASQINVGYDASHIGTISHSGGTVNTGDIIIESGSSYTCSNSPLINVTGNWTNNGTFTPGLSLVAFNGTGAQSISGSLPTSFNDITVTNTATPGVSVQNDQNLLGVLTLATNVVFDADGTGNAATFKLISTGDNPTQDASVAVLPSGAQVLGNVTVQRFMAKEGPNGGRIYRYISSPIQNATVADLQQEIPVSGTFTTSSVCSGCNPNAQSLFAYDETVITDGNGNGTADRHDGYIDFPAVTNTETFQPGGGYALYVRGNILSSALWDLRGPINSGNVTPVSFAITHTSSGTLANDGWNLVGNPFPSTIDWNAASGWTKTNLDATIYITDNGNALQQYATWNGVTGTNGGTPNIAIGQGFWIKGNGVGTPVLQANENIKTPGTQTSFFREKSLENLLRITMVKGTTRDETVIHFREDATKEFDSHADALKLMNTTFNLFTAQDDGTNLAINSMPSFDCNAAIRLNIGNVPAGNYQMVFSEYESFAETIVISLYDKFTSRNLNAREAGTYNFSITADTASYSLDRFKISFVTIPVNPDFVVSAAPLCEGSDAGIQIDNSQKDATYVAMLNGFSISTPVVGNGGEIFIAIPQDKLTSGQNLINVRSSMLSCISGAIDRSVALIVEEKHDITFVEHGRSCQAGVTRLTAFGAPENGYYNWYESIESEIPITGQHNSVFVTPILEKSRTYYVSAANVLGCEGLREPVFAEIVPLEPAQIIESGKLLLSNYPQGNQWYHNDILVAGATESFIEPGSAGRYTVEVTINDCTITSAEYIFIVTDIDITDPNSIITLSPNPATNKISIEIPDSFENIRAVQIVNMSGQVVGTIDLHQENGKKKGEVLLTNYSSGVYIIRIIGSRRRAEIRFVKL